jgi:four helix bundle protein
MYDLELRTLDFAICIRRFISLLPDSLSNIEDAKQLIKSSGSIGANYIEANEALSKKDFQMRIKISLKEAKESAYWIKIILETNNLNEKIIRQGESIYEETIELRKVLSSILQKSYSSTFSK